MRGVPKEEEVSRHRRFTDGAGFTRHCWECVHAKDWDGECGWCELTGWVVHKTDSPNNQCCHLPVECDYDDGRRA